MRLMFLRYVRKRSPYWENARESPQPILGELSDFVSSVVNRVAYMSAAKTCVGLSEYLSALLSRSSVAILTSLIMIKCWPNTVIELMGPTIEWMISDAFDFNLGA